MTVFLFLPVLLGAAELAIDHVTVAGLDLKKMQARLAAVGIPSEFGGPHSNHATEMALTSFPDGSYLELIAVQPRADAPALAAHYWSKQMRGNAGPTAWAVRGDHIAAEVDRLRAAGVTVNAPARSGRQRPDGTRLDWEAAPVGKEPNGTFFPFLIRDFTPREARALPQGHPTMKGFSGVKRVVIAVRDLHAAAARYRQAYGLPAPAEQDDASFGAHLASFAGTPVILAAPLDAQSWLAGRIGQFDEGPCAFILARSAGGTYKTPSQSRWFGADVLWFDSNELGWRLGLER